MPEIWNPNDRYILQAPPPASTMFTTELEYDGDKISGYAGSAFKAGTDLEFGYTDSDTISSINTSAITDVSLNNIVQTNSASWGGSALPISAGKGVKVNLVDNTLVFSNDETVLWENKTWPGVDRDAGVNSANMSESIYNFERIKIFGSRASVSSTSIIASNEKEYATDIINWQSGRCMFDCFFLVNSNNNPFNAWTILKFENGIGMSEISGGQKPLTGAVDSSKVYYHPYKVVGINRVAGGN